MKLGLIFIFLTTLYEFINLLLGKKVCAGKIYLEPSRNTIILLGFILVIVGYLYIKHKEDNQN